MWYLQINTSEQMKIFSCGNKSYCRQTSNIEVLELSTVIVFIVLEYSLSSVVKHYR